MYVPHWMSFTLTSQLEVQEQKQNKTKQNKTKTKQNKQKGKGSKDMTCIGSKQNLLQQIQKLNIHRAWSQPHTNKMQSINHIYLHAVLFENISSFEAVKRDN